MSTMAQVQARLLTVRERKMLEDVRYGLADVQHATDVADAEVPVMSARLATRREISAQLRTWYPRVEPTRGEMGRALDVAELRAWRRLASHPTMDGRAAGG